MFKTLQCFACAHLGPGAVGDGLVFGVLLLLRLQRCHELSKVIYFLFLSCNYSENTIHCIYELQFCSSEPTLSELLP
jgi:hypothetical protein